MEYDPTPATENHHEPDQATVENLRAAHGELFRLSVNDDDAPDAVMVARRPTDTDYKQFRAAVTEADRPEVQRRAVEAFARACIVWPDQAGVKRVASKYPAVLDTYGGKLLEMIGSDKKVAVTKL